MTLNKFMHPRNPYKTPPDFKKLAVEYPEFRKYLQQDLSGKVRLDFKDDGAVRELTKTLLRRDFGLTVEIPPDRLVPTLPLRMNYLLWIEDLINCSASESKTVRGIDIGTGASCIYPLLAARHFKWKMVGTEIDQESVKYAKLNVTNNNLEDFISVKQINDDSVLTGIVDEEEVYDFCMCNPPFFKDQSELDMSTKSRTPSRNPPRNSKSGADFELVAPGGETAFINRIIEDSGKLKTKIRIYTAMVGHKNNVNVVKALLKKVSPLRVETGEFCQGRTMRWAVAWTFSSGVNLKKLSRVQVPDKPPFRWFYPGEETLEEVVQKTLEILRSLQIKVEELEKNDTAVTISLIAHQNTWSHSRRKKRQKKRTSGESSVSSSVDSNLNDNAPEGGLAPMEDEPLSPARGASDGNAAPCDSTSTDPEASLGRTSPPPPKRPKADHDPILVEAVLLLSIMDEEILFSLKFISGSGGRESANQILQYLKNLLTPSPSGPE